MDTHPIKPENDNMWSTLSYRMQDAKEVKSVAPPWKLEQIWRKHLLVSVLMFWSIQVVSQKRNEKNCMEFQRHNHEFQRGK